MHEKETGTTPAPSGFGALPLLLKVEEVAEVLRTTRAGVYSLIYKRELPGVLHLGRRVLVRRDALVEWLRKKGAPSLEVQR